MYCSRSFAIGAATFLAAGLAATGSFAQTITVEKTYFKSIQGKWSGPGSIVAGKYKGTKFNCTFDGKTPKRATGMTISGTCRVGIFSQPMSIEIKKVGRSYRGQFLDGAKGKGLDIVSGRLRGKRLVVGINRKKLNGSMVANMRNKNRMQITISVKVAKRLIPVIGLTLNRRAGVVRTSATLD